MTHPADLAANAPTENKVEMYKVCKPGADETDIPQNEGKRSKNVPICLSNLIKRRYASNLAIYGLLLLSILSESGILISFLVQKCIL